MTTPADDFFSSPSPTPSSSSSSPYVGGSTPSPYAQSPQSQQQNAATTGESPHPISLRVMRLRRPDFTVKFPVVTEKSDFLMDGGIDAMNAANINSSGFTVSEKSLDSLNKRVHNDQGAIHNGLDTMGFSDEWALPNSMGRIYVGETFSCFISLHNHSYNPVQDVVVKIELHTGGDQKPAVLLDLSASPIKLFAAKSNKNFIVEQPLSQEQKHVLVCHVSYAGQTSSTTMMSGSMTSSMSGSAYNNIPRQMKNFTKMFPFTVLNPLGMNAVKVFTLQEHVFVHLELQNLTHGPLYVDVVKLDPGFTYDLISHCTHNSAGKPYEHPMIKGEIRKFLYELIPKNIAVDNKVRNSANSPLTSLGKIEFQWKGPSGEGGILITSPIQHRAVVKQEIELVLKKSEESRAIQAEKPFKLTCTVYNRSSRKVNLMIRFDPARMFPVLVDGKSVQSIGTFEPFAMKQVEISLFAMQTGVHNVGPGILLVDETTGFSTIPTSLCQIFVHPPHDKLTPQEVDITKEEEE